MSTAPTHDRPQLPADPPPIVDLNRAAIRRHLRRMAAERRAGPRRQALG